jgi:beta-glucosidase
MDAEGSDREHLDLPPAQVEFIRRAAMAQKNLVVVLHGGSAIRMPWVHRVSAVLDSFLAGESVGEAQVDLLFGDVNPSGKLAETFPLALKDTPCHPYFPGGTRTTEYRESVFVGYRYYASAQKPVLFPFGHGLSYTDFSYAGLALSRKTFGEGTARLSVTFRITNTGGVAGAEAAQVYVAPPKGNVFRPTMELKGFEKVFLRPNESKTVAVTLDSRSFSYYHAKRKDWALAPGRYEILVGASSADIRLRGHVTVRAQPVEAPYATPLPHYDAADARKIPDDEFAAVLGYAPPSAAPNPNAALNINSNLEDAAARGSKAAKGLLKAVNIAAPVAAKYGGVIGIDPSLRFIREMPLRSFALGSGGLVTRPMAESLAHILDGKDIKNNAKTLLKGAIRISRKIRKRK